MNINQCPFPVIPGREDVNEKITVNRFRAGWAVICHQCHSVGPLRQTKEQAVADWNQGASSVPKWDDDHFDNVSYDD